MLTYMHIVNTFCLFLQLSHPSLSLISKQERKKWCFMLFLVYERCGIAHIGINVEMILSCPAQTKSWLQCVSMFHYNLMMFMKFAMFVPSMERFQRMFHSNLDGGMSVLFPSLGADCVPSPECKKHHPKRLAFLTWSKDCSLSPFFTMCSWRHVLR